MNSEWKEVPLSSAMEIIGGGTPKTTNSEYWGGQIPWLSVVDFNSEDRWVYSADKSITEKGLKNSSTKILKPGYLIISARGTVGALSQLKKEMAFNQSCYGLNANPNITSNDFLYYALKSILEDIKRSTHGAVFDTITRNTFDHIKFIFPPKPYQKKVVEILSSIEEKIDLNRQMCKTLEDVTSALFKSWFIDFDPVKAKAESRAPEGLIPEIAELFPDSFEDSEVAQIPSGWKFREIGDLLDSVGGGTPNTKNTDFWDGQYNWATPKDLSSLSHYILLKTERQITEQGLSKISSGLLPKGTVLMSSRAPIGYVAVAEVPVAINQGFIAMKCNGPLGTQFVLQWTLTSVPKIKGYANGSTFQEISKKAFRPIKVIYPENELLNEFENIAGALHMQCIALVKQNNQLTETRDKLLPRLISGELSIEDVEGI